MTSKLGIIVLDTLRYDTFCDEMTATSTSAPHTYEQMYTTSRWTSPAHASLFTGYYPTEVGVYVGQQHLTTPQQVLAEQLRSAGYHTVALTENVNIDSFFEFDRGFDQFFRGSALQDRPENNEGGFDWKQLETRIPDDGLRRPIKAAYQIVKSDAPTLPTLRIGFEMYRATSRPQKKIDWATDKIEAAVPDTENLFLFANFMTPHYPYDPPEEYSPCEPLFVSPLELTLRDDPVSDYEHDRHLLNYRGAARYLDEALPRLLDQIDWDLLFVISDHGELFGEYGLRGHQYGVYEELVHVPAVAFGDLASEGNTTKPTSLVDIHRTLLDVADISVDQSHHGVNLLDDEIDETRVVYAESEGCEWFNPDARGIEARIPGSWNQPHYMVRDAEAMLLVDKDGKRTIDPRTGKKKSDHHSELIKKADQIRANRKDVAGDAREENIPDAVKQRLKRLGYM